jgi:hypothetical protein
MILELGAEELATLKAAEARFIKAKTEFMEAQEALRKKMLLAVAKGKGKTKNAQGQPIGWEFIAEDSCMVSND